MEEKAQACLDFEMDFAKVIRMYYCRMQDRLMEVGLYRGQPPILALLTARDGMSQKDLAAALSLSPATITVTIKRMEKAGLISREADTGDQRVLRVHLTEKGNNVCLQAKAQVVQVAAEMLQGFSPEESLQMRAYMDRMMDNMRKALYDAAMDEEE